MLLLLLPYQEFLFNYTQIITFLRSHHFGKCSNLIFLYIIRYNNISWRPHDPHPKIWGRYLQHRGLTSMRCIVMEKTTFLTTGCASGSGPLQPSSTCMKVKTVERGDEDTTVEEGADDEADEGSDADVDIV